jgi:hypothetical protein
VSAVPVVFVVFVQYEIRYVTTRCCYYHTAELVIIRMKSSSYLLHKDTVVYGDEVNVLDSVIDFMLLRMRAGRNEV